jgi:hypothetical protein
MQHTAGVPSVYKYKPMTFRLRIAPSKSCFHQATVHVGYRPRHFVTETDDLAAALDAAAQRWPGLSRAQLLVRLALEGDRAAKQAQQEHRQRRLAALRHHCGILTGNYGPDYLERLRQDWPA